MSFAKSMGKNVSSKYGQKLLDGAKKSTMDAIKTASKRAIQKTTETTGDLIGNKIADKITCASTELHSKTTSPNELQNNKTEVDTPKKDN